MPLATICWLRFSSQYRLRTSFLCFFFVFLFCVWSPDQTKVLACSAFESGGAMYDEAAAPNGVAPAHERPQNRQYDLSVVVHSLRYVPRALAHDRARVPNPLPSALERDARG